MIEIGVSLLSLEESGQSASVWFSGHSPVSLLDSLDLEDGSSASDVFPVLVCNAEDRNWVLQQAVNIVLHLSLFPVENPLVDLDPLQASFLLCPLSDFLGNAASCGIKQIKEEAHLFVGLANPIQKCHFVVLSGLLSALPTDKQGMLRKHCLTEVLGRLKVLRHLKVFWPAVGITDFDRVVW